MTPFHDYVQNYLDTVTININWLVEEINRLKNQPNPDQTKAYELMLRSTNQCQKVREIKEQLDGLEKLCLTLKIDSDKLQIDD